MSELLLLDLSNLRWIGGIAEPRIDQVVRALDGSVLGTGVYDHVHQVKDGRIVRMDIYPTAGALLGQ